jgi:hypothetical protein
MLGFLLKKTFFDLWDNLFRAALVNLGFIASVSIPVFIPPLLGSVPVFSFVSLFIGILWCFVYLVTAAVSLKAVSDYGSFGFGDFFRNMKAAWPAGLVAGLLGFFFVLIVTQVIPFYLGMESMPIVGLFFAAVIFWTLIIGLLSFQFFPAVRARLDANIFKIFKKCFLIFFDNTGFCIFSFIFSVIFLILSVFLAFLFPGPAGILLFLDEGLRLRILKYDWLEVNPGENRRKVPWDVLLIDDREKTGVRTLRNFIFPWKD